MSRKSGKRKRNSKARQTRTAASPPRLATEDRRSIAVTVAWMLSAMATLAGLIIVIGLWAMLKPSAEGEKWSPEVAMLPNILLFATRISSILVLLLTPLVYVIRPSPPPPLVTAGALLIAATPWLLDSLLG